MTISNFRNINISQGYVSGFGSDGSYLEILDYRMVGHGDDCGAPDVWLYRAHQSPDGKYHWHGYKQDCAQADCPRHYGTWISKTARRDALRLREYVNIRRGQGKRVCIQHVVLSPPIDGARASMKSLKGFEKMRSRAYAIARQVGLDGGALCFHADRIPSKFNDRTDTEEGPHFHGLVVGWIDPLTVKKVHDRTGWIIKGLGRRKDLKKTWAYVLSHCHAPVINPALAKSKGGPYHRITWFGALSYNKFAFEIPPEGIKCPVCGLMVPSNQWIRVDYTGAEGPPDGGHGVASGSNWQGWILDGGQKIYIDL